MKDSLEAEGRRAARAQGLPGVYWISPRERGWRLYDTLAEAEAAFRQIHLDEQPAGRATYAVLFDADGRLVTENS